MSHISYHGVFLCNDVTVVAQTMRFGMPGACGAKGELVEYDIEDYEVPHSNNVYVGFSLGKAPL